MMCDQFQRASEQFFSRRNLVPGRGSGGMRKRNYIEVVPGTLNAKFAADYFFQLRAIDELRDSQPADRNDETRPQNFDFMSHPGRTVANFVRSRNAISAARIFSGKAAADRCEINFGTDCSLIHPTEFFEPPKKSLASCVRKRSLQHRLPWTGGLTYDHYIAHDCAARDRRGLHARATTTSNQSSHVAGQFDLFRMWHAHECNE